MLSVIVPVYNSEQTLKQCLQSIIMQSYKNIEIIVVDDGSKDSSKEIVYDFIEEYGDIIKYIAIPENRGIGNARNIGLSNAKGRFVTFVDADDWVDSNLYNNAINKISKFNADIAIFGMKNEYENYISSSYRYSYKKENTIDNYAALRLLCRTYTNDIYISPIVNQKIYRKDLLKKQTLISILIVTTMTMNSHFYYY